HHGAMTCQTIRIDRRRLALRIARHLRPGLPAGVVKKEAIVNRREATRLRPGAGIGEGLKPKAVRELVKEHSNQIGIVHTVVIQSKIKRRPIQTSCVAEIYVELRIYFLRASVQIDAR